jgi:hypothetical protein
MWKTTPQKKAPEQFSKQLEPLIDRLKMPRAVIPMFDGNPLQYRQFTLAFRTAKGTFQMT